MHKHNHHHSDSSGRIALAFFLNVSFTVIEFIGGLLTNSTAIMADAVHDLGDSLSIGSAWVLSKLSEKSATKEFSFGYRRLSLLGALINGLVLLLGSAWVLKEAIPRLQDPVMPHAEGMLGLAVLGVVVNGFAAYRLGAGKTLNERVLSWHLMEDVLGWVAVLVVALVLQFVDWPILDPLLSIGFTLFILSHVFRNLWVTGKLFVQATPDLALIGEIESALLAVEGVGEIHRLHLWSLDGEHHVLTAHAVLQQAEDVRGIERIKRRLAEVLSQYSLEHTTIEIEFPMEECRDQTGNQDA